jgi:dipeptidyl aminopeptidase/acylaminoacyl peptidase
MRIRCLGLVAVAVNVVLLSGCSADESDGGSGEEPTASTASSPSVSPSPTSSSDASGGGGSATPEAEGPEQSQTAKPEPKVRAVSVLGLAEQQHRGDRLRIGAVRERTAQYTSYDVTYRSRSTTRRGEESYTISGVLNVPQGKGPFPAVVLAHGYIDPAVYVRGQGMTRERGYLAGRGYVALHVDYRNHAESDDDPQFQTRMRLGYTADVINAVKALRGSPDVPVDDERVALFGRSMGGGVILKALVAEPGLVQAAAPWASVSSSEAQNYDQFIRPDPEDGSLRDELARRWGTPKQNPQFWRENSSRPYFDRVTEPVLMVHGRRDDTCPPSWATATHRALTKVGVDARLQWYDDGHAFGPAFNAAMDRTVRFFDRQLG